MPRTTKYWYDGITKRKYKRKLKRFEKGSPEAKRFMSKLRRIKTGKTKLRRRTYYNGLYPKKRRKKTYW